MISVFANYRYTDPELIARFEMAGKRCGQLAIGLGTTALFGWATGIGTQTNMVTNWVAIQTDTAFCLILVGTSLLAAGKSRTARHWHVVQFVSATTVFGMGLLKLVQYYFGQQLGIDGFLIAGDTVSTNQLGHGGVALATAANFVLTGGALAIVDTKARAFSPPLALLALVIATLALLDYAYDLSTIQDIGFFSTMALCTAVGTLLVGLGILLVRPAHGALAVLVSATVGGVLARRMLPLAVGAPFLLGWLRIEGERHQLYNANFGVTLTSVVYVILFSLLIWRTAETLRRSDDLRLDAEQIKRAQEAQMIGLIESAMDAIVMLDETQSIIVFNPTAEKMFGYPRADILGSPLSKLLPPRFRAAHGEQMHAFGISGSASRRMGSLGSIMAIRADGTEFPAEASISHFDLGNGICYTAIVRDITERMRVDKELHASERRERDRSRELSDLLFAVPAAVCIAHDSLLAEMTSNELHDRWFRGAATGTTKYLGASGDASPEQDSPQDGSAILSGEAALRQAAAGVEIRDYEFKHVQPNGAVRYLFGNATPLLSEQGGACGAISAFVDVTALKLSELALLSVTASSVAKSDYITHMTHELRTPLATMLGYAQILEKSTPAPSSTQLSAIKQIIKAGWYLRDLITEVQALATIEADSAGLSCEPVSIDALLHDVHAMIAPLVSDAGLRVTLVGTTGLAIHANPVRIKQVMLNLLSNAIKYNRLGGSIYVSRVMDGQAQVRIGVRDTGHGLAPKELACLFQPFNRLGQEHGKEVGTGVGLVVTKKLVESMGGTIGVESEIGCGSLFWFSMPVATDSAQLVASA